LPNTTVTRPSYKAVFVSPHLDDAVFSCGGEIARLVQEGPVLVLNLFTRYLSEVKVRAVVLGAERYQEEQAAAQFLGFTSHNFGELDVSFRRPAYRSLGNIFRPPVREDLEDYLPKLREQVFAYLAGIDYERLYVPLAIGWHVDHMLTHLLFEPWMGQDKLIHFEDAPYCLIPHATRLRLDELGTYPCAADDLSLAPISALNAWWQTAMAYADTALMKNLRPWIVRKSAIPAVSFYLYRLMALHRRHAGQAPDRKLEPIIMPIAAHFERKVEAMALYRSQFREFFSSRDDCITMLSAYAERIRPHGGPLERYWAARVLA
jgi:LmbE family N-acetylglucosaminyl deacetylase